MFYDAKNRKNIYDYLGVEIFFIMTRDRRLEKTRQSQRLESQTRTRTRESPFQNDSDSESELKFKTDDSDSDSESPQNRRVQSSGRDCMNR